MAIDAVIIDHVLSKRYFNLDKKHLWIARELLSCRLQYYFDALNELFLNERTNDWMNERVSEWFHERMNKSMNERTIELIERTSWTNDWKKEPMIEWTSERVNELSINDL